MMIPHDSNLGMNHRIESRTVYMPILLCSFAYMTMQLGFKFGGSSQILFLENALAEICEKSVYCNKVHLKLRSMKFPTRSSSTPMNTN